MSNSDSDEEKGWIGERYVSEPLGFLKVLQRQIEGVKLKQIYKPFKDLSIEEMRNALRIDDLIPGHTPIKRFGK